MARATALLRASIDIRPGTSAMLGRISQTATITPIARERSPLSTTWACPSGSATHRAEHQPERLADEGAAQQDPDDREEETELVRTLERLDDRRHEARRDVQTERHARPGRGPSDEAEAVAPTAAATMAATIRTSKTFKRHVVRRAWGGTRCATMRWSGRTD